MDQKIDLVDGDKPEITIDFVYPPRDKWQYGENPKYLRIGLEDVRAADDIRIHYDFDRDGWVIEQASFWGPWESDESIDFDWQEVAFVQAWAREKEDQ